MATNDQTSNPHPQPTIAYLGAYILSLVMFIAGSLILIAGAAIALNGYPTGTIPLGLAVAAAGLLFIAIAAALKLLGDIAAKVVYGIRPAEN